MDRIADTEMLTLFSDETIHPHLIPVEINLEGWPFFSRQKTPEVVIEITQTISTEDGHLQQRFRATANQDYSLPGPFDEDVFVGVMAMVRRRGGIPKDGKIRFSTYELVKILGKGKRGSTYEKVRESLDRIGATSYYTENAFYVAESESLESYRFSLWTVHFSHAKSGDGRAAKHHTIKFDEVIVRSYNAGYLKLLDTDLFFRLKRPLAKAVYRLVDQKRRGSLSWSVDVRELRELLAMSKRYKAPARIWEVLAPNLRVLKRERFLESATLNGDTARFKIHPDYASDWYPEEYSEPSEAPSLREQAIAALMDKKVWPNRARALVDRFGAEKAFHALEVLRERADLEAKRKPGAYVAQVVEHADAEELRELASVISKSREAPRGTENPGSKGLDEDDNQQPDLLSGGDEAPSSGGDEAPSPPTPDSNPDAHELWACVLDDLAASDDLISPRPWFDGTVAVALDDETLTLSVPNSLAENYIASRFKGGIERLLKERLSSRARLRLEVSSPTFDG